MEQIPPGKRLFRPGVEPCWKRCPRGVLQPYASRAGRQFHYRAGRNLGYLGPNGAGKSTTVKMLTGLVEPSSSQIFYAGRTVYDDLTAFQRRAGYVPGDPGRTVLRSPCDFCHGFAQPATTAWGGGRSLRLGMRSYPICIYMSREGKPDPRLCVCATLRKATRSITQIYDTALRPSGLRATQFHILGEIHGAGEATITELTRRLVMDQTTLTRSVALLERNGLVSTVPKPDGRLKVVRLTARGKRALMEALPLWEEAQTKMLRAIGKGAWTNLHAQLNEMR